MNVAAYRNQYGPAMVFTLPDSGEPQHASIPQGPFPRALAQFADKGHALTWEQWAGHLAGHLPYFDSWSLEQVPDGSTPEQALYAVRHGEAKRILTG